MARRSRDDLRLPGLSLRRYSKADYELRLRRNCWLGLPTPFKLGSGAGLWWSALPFTILGTIWWTTDMVEHQGAVGLRGGMYITTRSRKDTCSVTSVLAEASYMRPTSLRYYTPEVHPPTPIGFFET
eukprot:6363994-Pyramimonas_sp.AAC.1